MTTSFDLYAEGKAPFLLDTSRVIDPSSIPAAKAFVEKGLVAAVNRGPTVVREYSTQKSVNFVRVKGDGEIYCSFARSSVLQKTRMTYRIPSKQKIDPTLTINSPFQHDGSMSEKDLDQALENVLHYAGSALQILENIDLDANNRQMDRITKAFSVYASSSLPQSQKPYIVTTTFPDPMIEEKGSFSFAATKEEADLLAAIGPALTLEILTHDPNTGAVSISLCKATWTVEANGPSSVIDRMGAYALLSKETAINRQSRGSS